MKLELIKASGHARCRYQHCQMNPEYMNESGTIKRGTLCVAIKMESASGWNTSFYCRDCITCLYADMKKVLDPRLWILT